MSGSHVLIAGSGRLADRLEGLLRPTRAVARVDVVNPGPLAPFEDALEHANIQAAASLYIVDDRDAANVQFALAALKVRPELAITMALSNGRLVPHLQELHPNLSVINPWEIVTPDIVRALKAPASTAVTSAAALPPARTRRHPWKRGTLVLMALAAAFATLLASATVLEVGAYHSGWIIDCRSVRRQQPSRGQVQDALERMKILRQIAAAARFDHDAAAGNHQIAAEQREARMVPEREMVGRVAGCMNRSDRVAAEPNVIAVSQRTPAHSRRRHVVRPRKLREDRAWKSRGQRRNTGRVIRMVVGDDDGR